ncbi:MAG TPA: glycosyltransferase family 2 protein [Polyangia bacterium]|jgi:glycosyltransferase involved in cell wall biosynthesis|nr:glycosyltransferase family 2 protein [Polyangia bacterium]
MDGLKLIIQIPCFNEATTLPGTLADLPRAIEGFAAIETLIIDDGSSDDTSSVARAHGVHHVVRLPQNRGLARAFSVGVDACLRLGADVVVNTDADNQYRGADIPALVRPILEGRAEMVVGDRQVMTIPQFSWTKRRLQRLGSWVVRRASDTEIPDVTSGFRAMSREAALRLFVHDDYTYTLETLIQAGRTRLPLAHVPITTNPITRPSRLISSIPNYIWRQAATILRITTMYRPLRTFGAVALLLFLIGLGAAGRFLYFYLREPLRSGHIQSLIFGAIAIIVAFQVLLFGMVADLVAANRRILEDLLLRVRRQEAQKTDPKAP